MATEGRKTSEWKGTWITHLVNVVVSIAAVIVVPLVQQLPEWLLAVILPVAAAISGGVQTSYNASRTRVKEAEIVANGRTANTA